MKTLRISGIILLAVGFIGLSTWLLVFPPIFPPTQMSPNLISPNLDDSELAYFLIQQLRKADFERDWLATFRDENQLKGLSHAQIDYIMFYDDTLMKELSTIPPKDLPLALADLYIKHIKEVLNGKKTFMEYANFMGKSTDLFRERLEILRKHGRISEREYWEFRWKTAMR